MNYRLTACALLWFICGSFHNALFAAGKTADFNPLKNVYYGDVHVHTRFSYDAFIFKTRATPDDAYRYGKGEPLLHPAGYPIRLRGAPLDFMAVTDHAEYLGIVEAVATPNHPLSKLELAKLLKGSSRDEMMTAALTVGESVQNGAPDKRFYQVDVMRSTWQRVIESANRHYQPGKFTTLIGYEFTSHPGYTLHRNVIFRGDTAPELPFSSLMSQNPEDLWRWLDQQRAKGFQALAIPHNSNLSRGHTFNPDQLQWDGKPYDAAYANLRMRNEPIVEITQIKGTSETHPGLSPNDEWADFEILQRSQNPRIRKYNQISGGYVREAYLSGLTMQETKGFNPYRFGLIGSSDAHNGGAPYEETSFYSKMGLLDGKPEQRRTFAASQRSASGLAGVWAEENTREAIFDALQRKETFATSGPRIRVRFFAGYDYEETLINDPDIVAKAYQQGVPMGSDLKAHGERTPRFLVWAMRDPSSSWLQRLQIIKGWVQDGKAREQVFDIACSDGLSPDPKTYRCPDNGAMVDLTDCSLSFDKGDAELRTLWSDPTFAPYQRAFYYVRVLENPTCRWSTWDAVRANMAPVPHVKKTIQERAWSSPIWYLPVAP